MIRFSESMIAAMTLKDLVGIQLQCIDTDDHSTVFSIAFDLIEMRDKLLHELSDIYELVQQLPTEETS